MFLVVLGGNTGLMIAWREYKFLVVLVGNQVATNAQCGHTLIARVRFKVKPSLLP